MRHFFEEAVTNPNVNVFFGGNSVPQPGSSSESTARIPKGGFLSSKQQSSGIGSYMSPTKKSTILNALNIVDEEDRISTPYDHGYPMINAIEDVDNS